MDVTINPAAAQSRPKSAAAGGQPETPIKLTHADDDADSPDSEPSPFLRKRGAVTACNNDAALRVAAQSEQKTSLHPPLFKKAAQSSFQRHLAVAGGGSALRGWRWIFDPDGGLDVSWRELAAGCKTIEMVKTEEELNALVKFETGARVHLAQCLPELGVLLQMFRRWMSDAFGGQREWFDAMDHDHSTVVTKEAFMDNCHTEGFTVSDPELEEIFGLCDVAGKDVITRDLTLFLEADDTVRERELLKLKLGEKYEQDKILVSCYENDHLEKPALKIRSWSMHRFEALPTIHRQRIVARETAIQQSGLTARISFIRYLRSTHGTEVRAWRRVMDPKGEFSITKVAFKHYCRKIQFEVDLGTLWSSFDPAGEGVLSIEQLSIQAADVFVAFWTWCFRSFGSCNALFLTPEGLKRRTVRRSDGSSFEKPAMSVKDFQSLLWTYGYPPLFGEDGDVILWYMSVSLDLYGGSLITKDDMNWLDNWKPTPWLVVDPDAGAWTLIRATLEERFGHLLRAWRKELDADNSNRLSWSEWLEACSHLRISGNLAGAWRQLDKTRVGYITLKDVSPESNEILSAFKGWAEVKFGSMNESFNAMDSDGGGTLTLSELRQAMNKFKCASDAILLFDVLSSNGRYISRKDFMFLNDWVTNEDDADTEFLGTLEQLWKEIFTFYRSREAGKSASRPASAAPPTCGFKKPEPRIRLPARFGGPAAMSTSKCIPADFVLCTPFPVSPYTTGVTGKLLTKHRPRSSVGSTRRQMSRSASDSMVVGVK